MENTPTPYQRNRRAGRAEALPEEQANPQSAAPQAVSRQSAYYAPAVPTAPQDGYQAAPRRVPVTPAVHPTDVPSAPHAAGLTSAHPRPVRPANQQPASWQNAPGWNAPTVPPPLQAYQAQQWQNASKTPRQPVQRTYGQPVRTEGTAAYPSAARPGAYAPQQPPVRRAPAPRPHPTAGQDFPLSDDPDVRRSPMREKRRREHADTQPRRNNRAARKQAVPSWLWTILSLALILVMGLIAAEALMHAHLKTAADEKQ
ncbi:MAG: hypothetical protein IJ343_01785, partial [Clostridia bacterium]|nr:hypothetical protein [Clostridia bacterium]